MIFKKHYCNFSIRLYNIDRNETTASLITQCKCGKTNHEVVHKESPTYKQFIKKV